MKWCYPLVGIVLLYISYIRNKYFLAQAMQKLWVDHTEYTREAIYSILEGDQVKIDSVTIRLMKNQEDIGNAWGMYHGIDEGHSLTLLLKDHISIAANIVTAIKNNDSVTVGKLSDDWKKNAGDIATNISLSNSFVSFGDMYTMLKQHLDLTAKEVTQIHDRDINGSIDTFDKIVTQAIDMGNDLVNAISKKYWYMFIIPRM